MAEDLEQEFARANMQIDDKVRKSVARTVDLMKRRKDLNDEIKNEREQMEKVGIHPRAYQDEVRNFKLYDEAERTIYMQSRKRMAEILTAAESDIFAEEMAERKRKAEKKAAKVTGKEGAPDPDNNPRSDPNVGGAKPQTIKEAAAASDAALAEGIAAIEGMASTAPPDVPGEQAEGEAALAAAMPKTKQAQSAKAAEKLAAAKLN